MTPDELQIIKLKSQILALETVVKMLCSALGRTFPSFLQSLHESGIRAKEKYSHMSLKGYPPEMSDLLAGEFQEAFDDLIKFITKENKQ